MQPRPDEAWCRMVWRHGLLCSLPVSHARISFLKHIHDTFSWFRNLQDRQPVITVVEHVLAPVVFQDWAEVSAQQAGFTDRTDEELFKSFRFHGGSCAR